MAPAATSGSDTARRTATISGSKPTTLCTWPPASTPCTIRASAPASAAARAARAKATWTSTRAPPARASNQPAPQPKGERHPWHALFDRHLEALVLVEVEHEVDAERTVRCPHDRADLLAQTAVIGTSPSSDAAAQLAQAREVVARGEHPGIVSSAARLYEGGRVVNGGGGSW